MMSDFPHWYDEDDDEVEALWTGRLSMDRVLQTLRDEITSRLAAEKRVQELEAQLAAQEWRPVTEPPTVSGDYLAWSWPGECEVLSFNDGYWSFVPITHWRPLPPPPQGE